MYILHLNGKQYADTGEIDYFFTCLGGVNHNSCLDTHEHRFFIECTDEQKKLIFNCRIAFKDILKSADWFYTRFGVVVKPFYTVNEVGFTKEQISDFADHPKNRLIYFKRHGDDNYIVAEPRKITDYFARISDQEQWDFDETKSNAEFDNFFTFPFSAEWWKVYFNFTIIDPEPPAKTPPKKRGPRSELANLLASSLNQPRKVRAN